MDLVVAEVEMNTMRCSTTQINFEISDGLWRPMESGMEWVTKDNAHAEIYVLTISLAELTYKS